MMRSGEAPAVKSAAKLDWIDVLIQVAITGCLVAVGAAVADDTSMQVPVVFMVIAVSLVILAWRRRRGLAALGEGSDEQWRLGALEQRIVELESGQERLVELEERLEFAERLLAQHREPGRLANP